MAGGSQTLETIIAINAKVGNGFSQVGATLTELGTMVDGISRELINFGKESTEVYKDYEKSMKEAEIALSTSYERNSKELADAMDTLNAKATEWAATTIFHTDDVANAINQAAHAGWDLNEILEGIPSAMQLAQAGSIDLSTAMEYIAKTTAAFDIPFEELDEFIDMWVYAANSSVGDVDDFGRAMEKMGSTMRFTDSKEELFALIGLMHDMGESGSTAATLLRTSMMRIIAPSGVASQVMEELGATKEEIDAIREDTSKKEALNLLASYGFSAFDENNQAKPMIEIYAELGEVLAKIAGGYENITKNKTTLGVLSTIFGNRGITGALNIVTALEHAVTLRDELLAGNAEGYGAYAQETMLDTLYGSAEIFESKMERLKQVVGGRISDELQSAMESIGGFIDDLSEMDPGKMDALIGGLEVIAAAGPGLLLAGTAFRFLGFLFTPTGAFGIGLLLLTAAAKAVKELKEADYKDQFGDMEMDMTGLKNYIHGLGEEYRTAYTEADTFAEKVQESFTTYRAATEGLSTNLFSMMLEHSELTPADYEKLLTLADDMVTAAQEAVYAAASGDATYFTELFGGEEAAMENPIYRSIIEKTNDAYEESQGKVAEIGSNLRAAIIEAYADENISEDEYNKILALMRNLSDETARAAAEAESEEARIRMKKWLYKAQTGSYEDITELAGTATSERDQFLAEAEERFIDRYVRLQEHGGSTAELETVQAMHEAEIMEIKAQYDDFLLSLANGTIANNGQSESYALAAQYAQMYMSGQLNADAANLLLRQALGDSVYAGGSGDTSNRAILGRMLGEAILSMGGEEEVAKRIAYYQSTGNTEMANRLRQFYTMEQLVNNFGIAQGKSDWGWLDWANFTPNFSTSNMYGEDAKIFQDAWRYQFEQMYGMGEMSAADAKTAIGLFGQSMESIYGLMTVIGRAAAGEKGYAGGSTISSTRDSMDEASRLMWDTIVENLKENYDLSEVAKGKGWFADGELQNYLAIWDLLYGSASAHAEDYRREPETGTAGIGEAVNLSEYNDSLDRVDQLREQGVEVDIRANDQELNATIDGADGQTLVEYLDGDAEQLHFKIMNEDGQLLEEKVDGDTTQLRDAILKYQNMTIHVNVTGTKLFAQGGRATEASIFGEAGAEWAIPEKHDARTAELLNMARAASGFTWEELLGSYGGLNAGIAQKGTTTVVYSPTINAADVTGVEQALADDKRRFEKWFNDRAMVEAAEVYS